jgi:hypothetical protein
MNLAKITHKPQVPDAHESAILLLMLIETREGTTRVRLSETTLKRLWGRHRFTDEFLEDVKEWLFRGGWTLFYAKSTFAAVQTSIVANWPRLSSKRLSDILEKVEKGEFEFEKHAHLVANPSDTDTDD